MSDLTGQRLGQYHVLSRIAKGSAAVIYKAYQPKLGRFVAIKVLSPQVIDDDDFLERFIQEARAIAQLDHPNIVPVYDFDRLGDTVYLVMKYVEGGTLKDLMTGRPVDLKLAVELTAQVGLALGYAHKQGVIHRDVKPTNILLGHRNWALLTDFGLAKILAGSKKLTRSGESMGTPDYMAPEQAQGVAVDHRADVYSLSVTLYEMVTGRVPFDAESPMGVIVKHITEPPSSPRQCSPDLPVAVENVILTALNKDPNQRYQTAEDFVSALVSAARLPGRHPLSAARMLTWGIPDAASDTVPLSRPPRPVARAMRVHWSKWGEAWAAARYTTWLHIGRVLGAARRFLAAHRSYQIAGIALISVAAIAVWALNVAFFARNALEQWGMAAAPTPVVSVVSQLTPTPDWHFSPTATLIPTPPPTATPKWRYLSPDAKIVPGIYVKAIKPEGLNLHAAAGFDQEFITTASSGSILYVLGGSVKANNLSWIRMRDVRTGVTGWGLQDDVIAYAASAP